MDKVTDKEIRKHLGHGEGNRKVRVKRDGWVEYYGSTVDPDHTHDYWRYAGVRSDLAREVASRRWVGLA